MKKILFVLTIFIGFALIKNIFCYVVKPIYFSVVIYDKPYTELYLNLTSEYKLIASHETISTRDYILNENRNKLYIKGENNKSIYRGEILELKKEGNLWICYGRIGNNDKLVYFSIDKKSKIKILGVTEKELKEKINRKIRFHDPRFYMIRFGGTIE